MQITSEHLINWAITLLIVITIVFVGLLAINQFLDYKYPLEQLMTPCELCVKLNPEWGMCYDYIKTMKPSGDIFYNLTIPK